MAAPNILAATSIYGKSVGATLTTTDTTDILTCGSGKVLKVKTIIVSNINGSTNASTTVYFYDSSATDRYALASTINVPADASLVVLGDNSILYLEEGDQIEAGSSGSNDLDIVISYEELSDA
jgi:hypothetical protein